MKLQNENTGQVDNFCIDKDQICSCDRAFVYDSLEQLQDAGWKDYKEPKRTWFIDTHSVPNYIDYGDNPITDPCYDDWNELGFCFETEEEAEKAVEKLKAWKRLEDKGFKFVQYYNDDEYCKYKPAEEYEGMYDDLDLLFGDEEQ